MTIYPPFKKTKIKLENIDEFQDFLRSQIGEHGEEYSNPLVGEIDNKGFLLEINRNYYNTGRSLIKGDFIRDTENYVEIYLITRKGILTTILSFLLLILIMGLFKRSIYTIHILIVVSIFSYLSVGLFHLIDLNSTEKQMHVLIQKAKSM